MASDNMCVAPTDLVCSVYNNSQVDFTKTPSEKVPERGPDYFVVEGEVNPLLVDLGKLAFALLPFACDLNNNSPKLDASNPGFTPPDGGRSGGQDAVAQDRYVPPSVDAPPPIDAPRQPFFIERVNVGTGETETNDSSGEPHISTDGRFIVFTSVATNLLGSVARGERNVYLRDRVRRTTTQISVSPNASNANGNSSYPSVNISGQFVAFPTQATNLVTGGNGVDEYVFRDTMNNTTERLFVGIGGAEPNGGSLFLECPFLMSDDGRYVVFTSTATNLVSGTQGFRGASKVYVRDRFRQMTEAVSFVPNGTPEDGVSFPNAISRDGLFVVFNSSSTTQVPNDTNNTSDVFVRDRMSNTTERISVSSIGIEGNNRSYGGNISDDGRYVPFVSDSTNFTSQPINTTAIFLRDRQAGTTEFISPGRVDNPPSISANGRFVVWPENGGIYVRDRVRQITQRVDINANGLSANSYSNQPIISGDGRYVVFVSQASNLVPSDTNNQPDVFVVGLSYFFAP